MMFFHGLNEIEIQISFFSTFDLDAMEELFCLKFESHES